MAGRAIPKQQRPSSRLRVTAAFEISSPQSTEIWRTTMSMWLSMRSAQRRRMDGFLDFSPAALATIAGFAVSVRVDHRKFVQGRCVAIILTSYSERRLRGAWGRSMSAKRVFGFER